MLKLNSVEKQKRFLSLILCNHSAWQHINTDTSYMLVEYRVELKKKGFLVICDAEKVADDGAGVFQLMRKNVIVVIFF